MEDVIQKPIDAKAKFGVIIEIDKNLDELAGKILYPEKVEEANQTLSGLKHQIT